MLWALRAIMFAGYAVVAAVAVRALVALVRREWMHGLKRAAWAAGLLVLVSACMAVLASAYAMSHVHGNVIGPSQKARLLGEAIATQMNFGAVGIAVGVLLGELLDYRTRRRRP